MKEIGTNGFEKEGKGRKVRQKVSKQDYKQKQEEICLKGMKVNG